MLSKQNLKILLYCAILGLCLGFIMVKLSSPVPRGTGFVSSKAEKTKVKNTLEKYLSSWQTAEPDKMYQVISSSDQENITLEEYSKQFSEFPVQPADYEIKDIKINPDQAKVVVLINWPDYTTGKPNAREETFYLAKEGNFWKIKESASLEK